MSLGNMNLQLLRTSNIQNNRPTQINQLSEGQPYVDLVNNKLYIGGADIEGNDYIPVKTEEILSKKNQVRLSLADADGSVHINGTDDNNNSIDYSLAVLNNNLKFKVGGGSWQEVSKAPTQSIEFNLGGYTSSNNQYNPVVGDLRVTLNSTDQSVRFSYNNTNIGTPILVKNNSDTVSRPKIQISSTAPSTYDSDTIYFITGA